jgi:hypothetical protein
MPLPVGASSPHESVDYRALFATPDAWAATAGHCACSSSTRRGSRRRHPEQLRQAVDALKATCISRSHSI